MIPDRHVLHVGLRGVGPAAGTPGHPPMILLHAFPLDAEMWAPLEREFAERGATAHGFDYPGFGTTPLWDDVEPSLDAIADAAVATLRDGIGALSAHWVGCSMGGYVALAIAERHPEAVAGLGLIDTRAQADDAAKRASRLDAARQIASRDVFPDPAGAAEGLVGVRGPRRDAVVSTASAIISRTLPAAAAWGQRAMASRPDRTDVLLDVKGPVVVAWGELDAVTDREDAETMARVAGTTAAILPGVGHLSPLEDPGAVADALRPLYARQEG